MNAPRSYGYRTCPPPDTRRNRVLSQSRQRENGVEFTYVHVITPTGRTRFYRSWGTGRRRTWTQLRRIDPRPEPAA